MIFPPEDVEPAAIDVLVVGGGPGGLSAAQVAASLGCRVVLLERGAEIGGPIRTSGASWLADMADLGIPGHLLHPLHELRFIGPRREVVWPFPRPVACVLDVRGVYQHLAHQAAKAGVQIRPRTTVTRPIVEAGQVVGVEAVNWRGQRETRRAAVCIDASGTGSVLAVNSGLFPPHRRVGVGAELDLLAPSFPSDAAALLVGRQVAPGGYAWAFPHGQGRVRLGVGVLRPASDLDPRALVERLVRHPSLAPWLMHAQPVEIHQGVLPAERPPARLSSTGLLVVGDAASQASPLVGEGIRYAIRAGRMAGETAALAAKRGDVSSAMLATYDRHWRARFGAEMRLAGWLSRRLARYGDRNWRVVTALLGCLSPAQAAAALHGDPKFGWWLALALRSPWLAMAAAGAFKEG